MHFHHPHNHKTTMQLCKMLPSVRKRPQLQIAREQNYYIVYSPPFSKVKIILSFHFTAGKPESPQRELVAINIHAYKCQLKLGLKVHNEARNTAQQKDILSLQLTRQVCCPWTRSSAPILSSRIHCLLFAH